MRAYPAAAGPPPRVHSAVTSLLNDALAIKVTGALRCRRHHFLAKHLDSQGFARMFLAHSGADQDQADLIAERIVQLGGVPEFAPAAPRPGFAPVLDPRMRPEDMARESLEVAYAASDAIHGLLQFVAARDQPTRRLLRTIVEAEQGRAAELAALLAPSQAGGNGASRRIA